MLEKLEACSLPWGVWDQTIRHFSSAIYIFSFAKTQKGLESRLVILKMFKKVSKSLKKLFSLFVNVVHLNKA